MAIIRYTSTLNLVLRGVLMFIGLIWLGIFASLFEVSMGHLLEVASPRPLEPISWALGFAGIILMIGCIPGDGDDYLDGVTSYVYANVNLGASISWEDSKRLTAMFASNAYGQWYPVREIKNLPKESRREAIMLAAARVGRLAPPLTVSGLKKEARRKLPLLMSGLPVYLVLLYIVANQLRGIVRVNDIFPWALVPVGVISIVTAIPWITAFKHADPDR